MNFPMRFDSFLYSWENSALCWGRRRGKVWEGARRTPGLQPLMCQGDRENKVRLSQGL